MVRRTGWSVCAYACLLSTLAVSGVARAQVSAEEKATAEAVFEEGMRLIKVGNFAEACPKFEMSQRVEPAVGTMLYLAECYENTNRTASSWAMFREAASLAETSNQVERMKTAQARAKRLEPRLAWLTIDVPKDPAVPGLQIRRNGVPVSAELSGTASPVDPGEVLVEATAPGYLPYSTKVKVAAKGRVSVTIPALQPSPATTPVIAAAPVVAQPESGPPAAVNPPPKPAGPSATAPTPVEHRSPIPWIVGGAGVAALGVGTYFGLTAISNADKARDLCPNGQCHDEAGQTAADHAHTQATLSNVSFILGSAAVATGVVLYFTLPTKQSTQVGLVPMADRSTLGLTLRGKLEL
jgi:serine/threonine-protein kinase